MKFAIHQIWGGQSDLCSFLCYVGVMKRRYICDTVTLEESQQSFKSKVFTQFSAKPAVMKYGK